MSHPVHPPKPTGTARTLDRGPSLRWRIRRWILKKLDAWPREKPEPTTEWGRLRRREREKLVEELKDLRAAAESLVMSCKSSPLVGDEEHVVVPISEMQALLDAISTSNRREIRELADEIAALVGEESP